MTLPTTSTSAAIITTTYVTLSPQYPLLLESLLNYTDQSSKPEEYERISRSLERAREILAYVNAAVRESENTARLKEIQRKLDQSSLAKRKDGGTEELKGVRDAHLDWQTGKELEIQ